MTPLHAWTIIFNSTLSLPLHSKKDAIKNTKFINTLKFLFGKGSWKAKLKSYLISKMFISIIFTTYTLHLYQCYSYIVLSLEKVDCLTTSCKLTWWTWISWPGFPDEGTDSFTSSLTTVAKGAIHSTQPPKSTVLYPAWRWQHEVIVPRSPQVGAAPS